jgi:hypothetical protein
MKVRLVLAEDSEVNEKMRFWSVLLNILSWLPGFVIWKETDLRNFIKESTEHNFVTKQHHQVNYLHKKITPLEMLPEDSEVYEKISFRLVFLTVFRSFLDLLFNGAISSAKFIFGAKKLKYHYSDHMRTCTENNGPKKYAQICTHLHSEVSILIV